MINKSILSIVALLLFLTSATAVYIFTFRLSDISIFALVVIIFFIYLKQKEAANYQIPFIYLFGLLATIIVSTIFQLSTRSGALSSIDFGNVVGIPVAICIAFYFGRVISAPGKLMILKYYNIFTICICFILYLYEGAFGRPDWIEILDETGRYSALSQNPNQLALYLLPIPFIALFNQAIQRKKSLRNYMEIALVAILNVMTFGKGLFVAWVAGFAVIGLFGIHGVLNKKLIIMKVFTLFVSLPLLYFLLLPIWNALYTGDAPGSIDGQGEGRITLWINGLLAWTDAPFIGHGPGHYSGLMAPFEGVEAHNLFIDWLTAYGTAGGITLLIFYMVLIRKAFLDKSWIVIAFYASLLTQTMFHFYGRQPVYWLWWVIGYYVSTIISSKGSKN